MQVEKILDKRTQKGGYTEYLVKWRNYEVGLRPMYCQPLWLFLNSIFIFLTMYALASQDPEENTWEPLENLGEAEKAIKLFEKEQVTKLRDGIMTIGQILQELKGHAPAKAQGQNNKRTYAKVLLLLMLMESTNSLHQALAGNQAKEPASKTARVEVDLTKILLLRIQNIQVKDKPRGFGRGLAAEKIIGMCFS